MTIELELHAEQKTGIIRFSNGHSNTFTVTMLEELAVQLESLYMNDQINTVILTGVGKYFSLGGDIPEMVQQVKAGNPAGYVDKVVPLINRIVFGIATAPIIVIAAVNGTAAGGGLSLALACDYRIASDRTKLAPAFGGIALTPDSGSSVFFPMYFGYGAALINTITSGVLDINAYQQNMSSPVNREAFFKIVTSDQCVQEALGLAASFSSYDRHVIAGTKKLMNEPIVELLKRHLDMELDSIRDASSRESFITKVSNFFEKMSN